MKRITILTGAGISAESGIKTFRDSNGLWEGHDVKEVATPEGFLINPKLVLDFYNQRRAQLLDVTPNAAHSALVELEKKYSVNIVTQNVDDLHERAGSKNVLHLHGELLKSRSTVDDSLIYNCNEAIDIGDTCEKNSQLRPHIVWFGEAVPMLDVAIEIVAKSDILVIIGTSMQVYPAASLVNFVMHNTPIYFIDPKPTINTLDYNNLTIIKATATQGMEQLVKLLS
ncbi:MAG: NAD-dependent deacylase [Flavobacteriaceae bacterium]